MGPAYSIRVATIEDSETITAHRRAIFRELGYRDEQALERMCAGFRTWLQRKMAEQEYVAWLAVAPDASVAAGLGLWLLDWPPPILRPDARRARILNVYTEFGYRRIGLARQLMETALDWCRANHVGMVILNSTDDGRALYESLGFEPANEMRLPL